MENYIVPGDNMVQNSHLDFELTHGALQGFKTSTSNLGYEDPPKYPREFAMRNRDLQETIVNDAVDHHLQKLDTVGTQLIIIRLDYRNNSTSTIILDSRVLMRVEDGTVSREIGIKRFYQRIHGTFLKIVKRLSQWNRLMRLT